ncbi:acyl-CoA dehydrogenase family protein, partial [Streptomyces lonegramiae]
GQGDDARVQDLAGRALVRRIVKKQLIEHVGKAIGNGSLPPNAGTLIRLFHAETTELEVDTALAIAGTAGVVDEGSDDAPELAGLMEIGVRYLSRQTGSLGGGSSEMARNVIGERILGFPREHAADRGVPFNQVKRNKS